MIVPDVVTISGQPVCLQDPTHTAVVPRDLEVHLSRTCRYLGAIPVSVLEHLAFCVDIGTEFGASPELLAHLAIHDAHEAYVGDVASRFKLPEYRGPEKRWERWVHECLGVQLPAEGSADAELAKLVDVAALFFEMEVYGHPGLRTAKEHLAGFHALLGARVPDWHARCLRAWRERRMPSRPSWDVLCNHVPLLRQRVPHRPVDESAWSSGTRHGPHPRCWVRPAGDTLQLKPEWWTEATFVDEERDAAFAAELAIEALGLEDAPDPLLVDVLVPGDTRWTRVEVARETMYVACAVPR